MPAKRLLQCIARNFGLDVVPHQRLPADLTPADRELIDFVRPYTMTRPERIIAPASATRWLVTQGVASDAVECGVRRGGLGHHRPAAPGHRLLRLDQARARTPVAAPGARLRLRHRRLQDWKGSRQAVDEYLAEHHLNVLMHRLDYSGPLIVKP